MICYSVLVSLHSKTEIVLISVRLGGIQVVCNSLVRSSQQFVSVGPGIISTIMQNMSSLGATLADEKAKAADSENVEGLFNFAPLGEASSEFRIRFIYVCKAFTAAISR